MCPLHRPPLWAHYLFLATTLLSWLPSVAHAASFTFSLSTPIQCSNMTVSVQGGVPPYQLIVIPVGLQNPEYRRIINLNLTQGQTSLTFLLAYPTNTQFVAFMNDATGVGAGGTGVATTVAASDDTSCLVKTDSPLFYFFMKPLGYLTQCQSTNLSWSAEAQGDVTLYGLIPGGQTFLLRPNTQSFFLWDVSVRAGTSVTLIAGDSRGIGSGGSAGPFIVNGSDTSCINDNSPSSTAGSPAGAVTAGGNPSSTSGRGSTSTRSPSSTSGSGSGGGGGSNTGAIVGGVVGGIVGSAIIAGLLFWYLRGTRSRSRSDENDFADRPRVDLAGEDDEPGTPPSRSDPPMIEAGMYHPEPFTVHEAASSRPSIDTGTLGLGTVGGVPSTVSGRNERLRNRRASRDTLGSTDPSTLATPTSRGRGGGKSPHPPSAMRATNFVQHEDAGALDAEAPPPGINQEELVELPPSYSALRPKKGQRNSNNVATADADASGSGSRSGSGNADPPGPAPAPDS